MFPYNGGGGGNENPPDVDPIIEGLLKRLPKSGDVWPITERKLWLQLLEGSFQLIYKDAPATSAHPKTIDTGIVEAAAAKAPWQNDKK